jgi:hypothetical protein
MHSENSGAFCLYLWRAANAPGALYIAKDLCVAQALCAALVEEGYLVRAVNLEADVEYRITGGTLVPVAAHSEDCSVKRTSPRMSPLIRRRRAVPDIGHGLVAARMDS